MIKKICLGLAAIIAVVLGIVAMKPAAYNISREISIAASPETIFPYISNSRNADSWMPWAEMDSQVKMSYSGPDAGVGSTSSWESSGRMGVGKAEVIEMAENLFVTSKISYIKPMEFTQISEFRLTPSGAETKLSWSVKGENSFIGRLMCFVTMMDMDKYVGAEFEKGLKKLKNILESKK